MPKLTSSRPLTANCLKMCLVLNRDLNMCFLFFSQCVLECGSKLKFLSVSRVPCNQAGWSLDTRLGMASCYYEIQLILLPSNYSIITTSKYQYYYYNLPLILSLQNTNNIIIPIYHEHYCYKTPLKSLKQNTIILLLQNITHFLTTN